MLKNVFLAEPSITDHFEEEKESKLAAIGQLEEEKESKPAAIIGHLEEEKESKPAAIIGQLESYISAN